MFTAFSLGCMIYTLADVASRIAAALAAHRARRALARAWIGAFPALPPHLGEDDLRRLDDLVAAVERGHRVGLDGSTITWPDGARLTLGNTYARSAGAPRPAAVTAPTPDADPITPGLPPD